MNETQETYEQPEPSQPHRCIAELAATLALRHASAFVTSGCFKQHQRKINYQ